MGRAIYLNDELGVEADEIDNVSIDRMLTAELQALLEERQAARKAKDFKRADTIRGELKAKGWVIEDTLKGARLKRV
jgi:cysteinyl-tRNA synthetase